MPQARPPPVFSLLHGTNKLPGDGEGRKQEGGEREEGEREGGQWRGEQRELGEGNLR